MDFKEKKHIPNKQENAGLISKLFFWWIVPLFKIGNKKDIGLDDLNNVSSDNLSEKLTSRLQTEWDVQCAKAAGKQNGARPFLIALLKTFGTRYILFLMIFFFDTCVIRIGMPLFLKWYIRSFNDERSEFFWQLFYASGICILIFCHTTLIQPTTFQMCVSGMRCRVASSSLIYRKTLRLSKASQGKSTTGAIVNLISNDVSRFDYNLFLIAFIFVGPVQLVLFFYLLWVELGWASCIGVGYVLLLSPSQYIIGKLSAKFRMEIAEKTDERSRIMNEIILGIRLIKMYAWEKPFSGLIKKIRELEFQSLKKRSLMRSSYIGVYTSNFTVVPFFAIVAYGLFGNYVTPDKAFFAVAIFNAMTENMMYFAPNACACIGELMTSIKRIEDFLLLEEREVKGNNFIVTEKSESNNIRIQMSSVSASWESQSENSKPTLDNLSVVLEEGQLVMVVGPVGSGKTSFLQLLIGELPIIAGTCERTGSIAYTSQEAWIFPGSVRQNILFGREYEEHAYKEVLSVCALEDDLIIFPYGDLTIVGERGVALSGGQKARINLARSLYQSSQIYLLDDPLSAVDSAVSKHIFDKCINGHLKGKLRILVTHQLQYLPQADHVIVLEQGKITAQGTYSKLMELGTDFVGLLARETDDEKNPDTSKELEEIKSAETVPDESVEEADTQNMKPVKILQEKQEVDDESTVKGAVSAKTYWNYFRAGDSFVAMSCLALGYIINQTLITTADYWLCIWTNSEVTRIELGITNSARKDENIVILDNNNNGTSEPNQPIYSYNDDKNGNDNMELNLWDRNYYINVYIGLAVSVFIIDTVRAIYLFMYTMKISNNIHSKMFSSLIKAPVKFFDENPSGRIMNRFTKDIGALDEYLPLTVFDTLDIGFRMVGILVIVVVTNYYIVFPVIVLIGVYALIRVFYVRTARNIKRVEAITRSPLYTHVSSSIHGLTTIRSSNSQNILISQFDSLQDIHSATWYHFLAGNGWFALWLEITSIVFIAFVTFSFLAVGDSVTSGQVGVAMANLFHLMNIFQFGMRQSAETENLMTSVERTLEYTKIKPESYSCNKKDKPSKDWPTHGKIKFNQVFLKYDGKNDVLKNLTFEIQPKEKIGICGRTGAGKSSIISALFRLSEISSGEITIDEHDIKSVGLKQLRTNISIIPQDPVLFSGTIRYNLDPFDKFSDDQLWQVLEGVELKELITALDYKVREEGSNFSVGQRQLVCLARAILRKNKILVLDEATANVDPRTDNLIQQTIRNKFSDCTIVTIAHRLQSVMDCDRILVMSNGEAQEFDSPHLLLQNPDGFLSKMISHTGAASENYLREIALQSYQQKTHLETSNEETE